ncbi:NUDIX hydrolase [Thermogemmatispora carboxidivorans]|uniref:NUDIX hydrolase n=1 Tax=Thermogemmatispora carboxidivorans TaxID=1382306 RepID=UPI00138DDB43|nr:NUDIX hydrolase [Thermogemmatispora carboxidivorans]
MTHAHASSFVIGVGGHQQLGDDATVRFLTEHFSQILAHAQQAAQADGRVPCLRSAVARGADRLFLELAFQSGLPVEVVIPCQGYEQLFQGEERAAYELWLSRARQIHQLSGSPCSDEAYLAAGEWIVETSDLLVLAWNGLPAAGKGGTADMASYARFLGKAWIHLNTRRHHVTWYPAGPSHQQAAPRREQAQRVRVVYQGPIFVVKQYELLLSSGRTVTRDVVERPESVLVLPVGQQGTILLIEERDLAVDAWQLRLPGGRITASSFQELEQHAQQELREETGYRAGRLEKLLSCYSHPGYVSHRVHLFVASDLEWDPLELEEGEEIRVRTMTLAEALAATSQDDRCDPEAALALWLYAGKGVLASHDHPGEQSAMGHQRPRGELPPEG